MDLGLAGKTAIVCASSRGLGLACAQALAGEGVHLVLNGRNAAAPAAARDGIARTAPSVRVALVVGSVTDPSVRSRLVEASDGAPDILVTNAGGPPHGDFRKWSQSDWQAAMDQNCLSAIEMIRMVIDGMMTRGFGRIVNVTSMSVRMPVEGLDMSNAARAALANFAIGIVPMAARGGVTINNLLPGPFATQRMSDLMQGSEASPNPVAGRMGDPAEFGAACAFLCSVQAAYINGQNLLIDGGLSRANF